MKQPFHRDAAIPVGGVALALLAWRFRGGLHVSVIAKATFSFADEAPMFRAEPQPVLLEEVHHNDRPNQSIRFSVDRVPYLRRADVLFTGHAHAPPGTLVQRLPVRLALAGGARWLLDKTLLVQEKRGFQKMPLVYERAFGGLGHPENPLGIADEPNIVDPRSDKIVAGFAPIGTAWPARRRLLGQTPRDALRGAVYDIPDAFDWAYFQSAPPDQQVIGLRGDEWIVLDGLHPLRPRLRMRLPGALGLARVYDLSTFGITEGQPLALHLDTLRIDGDEERCSLTFRGVFSVPSEAALRRVRVAACIESAGTPVIWPDPASFCEGTHAAAPEAEPGIFEGTIDLDRQSVTGGTNRRGKDKDFAATVLLGGDTLAGREAAQQSEDRPAEPPTPPGPTAEPRGGPDGTVDLPAAAPTAPLPFQQRGAAIKAAPAQKPAPFVGTIDVDPVAAARPELPFAGAEARESVAPPRDSTPPSREPTPSAQPPATASTPDPAQSSPEITQSRRRATLQARISRPADLATKKPTATLPPVTATPAEPSGPPSESPDSADRPRSGKTRGLTHWAELEIDTDGEALRISARGSRGERPKPHTIAPENGVRSLVALASRIGAAIRRDRALDPATVTAAQALHEEVFRGEIRDVLVRLQESAKDGRVLVRLFVHDRALKSMPWEALCRPGTAEGFLATDPRLLLARGVASAEPWKPREVKGAVRILGIAPDNHARSLDVLRAALAPSIESGAVEWMEPISGHDITPRALLSSLRRGKSPHVLHWLGHGGVDAQGRSVLRLSDDDDGQEVWMSVETLARELSDGFAEDLRLVTLEACEGAKPGAFGSAAEILAGAGADAVVAYLWPVRADVARVFSAELYGALTGSERGLGDVGAAVSAARRTLLSQSADAFSPVLYLRGSDSAIFDFRSRRVTAAPPARATLVSGTSKPR
jgi:hypothetical protein